jgi:hypothetical protein
LQKRKKKKKNMTFLFVWDKVSYTGSFLVVFPCLHMLYPQLVYLLQLSTFYFSLCLMVVSASLRFLNSQSVTQWRNELKSFQRKKFKWLKNTWKNSHHPWPKEMQIKTTLKISSHSC